MAVLEALRNLELESIMRVEVLTPFVVLECLLDVLEGPRVLPIRVLWLKVVVQVKVEAQCNRTRCFLNDCISVG